VSTPTHLLPERCYVCGAEAHEPTPLHVFTSNAEANLHLAAEAARHSAESVAARYVAENRPY
jgi:hypothetical protein